MNGNERHHLELAKIGFDTPGGRTREYGPQSGEVFRIEWLREAVEQGGEVVINLDGSTGGTSSFYDESIGWLIRAGVLSRAEALRRIHVVTNDEDLRYIPGLVKMVMEKA